MVGEVKRFLSRHVSLIDILGKEERLVFDLRVVTLSALCLTYVRDKETNVAYGWIRKLTSL